MDIIIYLYHNSRFFYDMDIPANSGICNECDNRICIKLIDIVMWILRARYFIRKKKGFTQDSAVSLFKEYNRS